MVERVSLINIPWNDILFIKVLPLLNLKDLYNLRSVSSLFKTLVETYLQDYKILNLAPYKKFNKNAFWVINQCCTNIRVANFSRCTWLQDDILICFLTKNDKIVEINLNYCETITPRGLQPLIINCKNLLAIELVGCKWLTPGALETLTCHHTKLESVDISRCTFLTEKSLLKLIVKFPKLKNLSIAHIPAVTDYTVMMITEHSKNLKFLNIDGCKLTIDGVKQMLWKLQSIEAIKISGAMLVKDNLRTI